uniref:Uncharacterized protein n=1 Tax=Lactuca sativa TaxID=4236 RepID=A0A9R1VUS3_LACSA|nr:hypothetical protein LSAT_V11C400174480 [Lactuca sativa]
MLYIEIVFSPGHLSSPSPLSSLFQVYFDFEFSSMPSSNSSAPSVIQATKVDAYSLLLNASSHEIFPFEGLPSDCVMLIIYFLKPTGLLPDASKLISFDASI